MNEELTLDDLSSLAESVDVECKAAQGRDGKGELPDDFWKSYSAMANGDGGVIWLRIQEKPRGTFRAVGLADVERVRKALWDNLHNRKQVSANLLSEQRVQPVIVEGKTVLRVEVPRAARQSKPVHLGSDPFGGTYLRRYEGDYQADEETVRRMMAERIEDSRDERVLKGFDFSDLDMDTVAAYRNRFAAVKPGHVWADLSVADFLDLSQLSQADIAVLRQKAMPVSERLRSTPELVQQTVLALCEGRYLGLRTLTDLLNRRDDKDLRTRILNPLLVKGVLLLAYPKANDPRQAYISNTATNKDPQA